MSKLTHPYGLDLARAKSIGLWLPNRITASPGLSPMAMGLPLTQEGTVTYLPPANAIMSYMTRMGFANVAGVAGNTAGLRYPTASDHPLLRGNTDGVGGFYFSCRWVMGLWPANTSRMFVGISAATTSVAAQDGGPNGAGGTLLDNSMGIMHDSVDGANELYFVGTTTGDVTKTRITGGAQEVTFAAGRAFWLEMYQWSNQGSVHLSLWDMNTGASLLQSAVTVSGHIASTTFVGPQCQVSNGSVAGDVARVDISNLYFFVGD